MTMQDTSDDVRNRNLEPPFEARCFCGSIRYIARVAPTTVSYCHCADCRRATGGPVAALAAFPKDQVSYVGEPKTAKGSAAGTKRLFCGECGSALAFMGDYVPNQIFIHAGLFFRMNDFVPEHHSYVASCATWLDIDDDLPRYRGSARDALNSAADHRALSGV